MERWLRAWRLRNGLSQDTVGRAIGYSGDSARQKIYKVEKGDEELTATQLLTLAHKFNIDPAELLRSDAPAKGVKSGEGLMYRAQDVAEPDADVIPILALVKNSPEIVQNTVGFTPRPPILRGIRGAYAVYCPDDTMEPRYHAGWLLYVNPNRPPRAGRDAVIYLRDPAEPPLVRQLRTGPAGLEAVGLSGGEPLARDAIDHLHVIVASDQDG